MVAAELFELRRFRVVERAEEAPPAPGEVQVRVDSVGICGSDIHYYADGGIGDTRAVYPVVLGHEPTGEILAMGTGVSGWSAGDRVALEPAMYCYHCEFCLTGRHNVCDNIRFLSTPPEPGFFRERLNLPARNVLPLPVNIGLAEGTLFEPLAVVLHSMKFASLQPGETAAVFGAGPIGLLSIAVLKLSGASRVWSVEPVAQRRELALALGADAAIDPRSVDPVAQILADTGKRGVDVSIDCVARDDSHNQCLHVTRNAGRVVITGIPSELRMAIEFHVLRRKELVFYNVRRSCHESDIALRMLAQCPSRFAPIVTHRLPLSKVGEAFSSLESAPGDMAKVVLSPSRP